MNIYTPYMLAAVLSITGIAAMAPAMALEQACPDCDDPDGLVLAAEALLNETPISVWTDADAYYHGSTITVEGVVANMMYGHPVTIIVTSPINNIVTFGQIEPRSDGTYTTTLNTAGDLWKYDGMYTIRVQYGSHDTNNKVMVEMTGGDKPLTDESDTDGCSSDELEADGYCIPYSITGGSVTGAHINPGTSIVIDIESTENGKLVLSPDASIFSDLELAFVDNEQWDDVHVDGNDIKIYFPAGAEKIEVFGKFVIPEFGTVAVLILAVAIVAIVAVSTRSRLGIAMPRY